MLGSPRLGKGVLAHTLAASCRQYRRTVALSDSVVARRCPRAEGEVERVAGSLDTAY